MLRTLQHVERWLPVAIEPDSLQPKRKPREGDFVYQLLTWEARGERNGYITMELGFPFVGMIDFSGMFDPTWLVI